MYPKLYIESTKVVRVELSNILQKYSKELKLEKYVKVIDVGCGPGNITNDLLHTYLHNTKSLIGIDNSAEMIRYAQEHYGKNPNLKFQILDITTSHLPQALRNEFDLVTSFYCIHVESDIKKIFENMYAMLKPGGDLFVFIADNCFPINIWKNLAQNSKWKQYMNNFQETTFSLQRSTNFVQLDTNLLKEIGFNVNSCTKQEYQQSYDRKTFLDLMKSVHEFDIPKHLENDFILDHLDVLKSFNLINIDKDGQEQITILHDLIIVYANKSLET
ncbi:hypothetical protein RN001_002088 [Aquatica leii]|uniref:Methyltransferase domain-containing protein n=1 Tax=Aquatica leii TaxID=1421715 RepID=A0AAN7Q8C5_9COLE|nr:hypothetical protein RN001_002088 [Aquatica leii]